MKSILIILFFISTLVAKLPQELIDNLEIQKQKLPNLETQYQEYDAKSYEAQQKYARAIMDLVPSKLIIEYKNKTKDEYMEFIKLYAPLLNYQAYFMIDKLYKDKNMLTLGSYISKLLVQTHPQNIAYLDTFFWGVVRGGGELDIAKAWYEMIREKIDDVDINNHYKYILNEIEKQKEFSGKKAIELIKQAVENVYFTKKEFDKQQLFNELDIITTDNKDEFIEQTNFILEKYVGEELEIFFQENSKEFREKMKNVQWIDYTLENGVLTLKPNLMTSNLHDGLKDILKNNTYQKIILDLRGNHGGSFTAIREIISSFLPNKYIHLFEVEEKGNRITMFQNFKDHTLDMETPLEILIDYDTKRGAMYIASVLSKQKRAKVIGEYETIDNSLKTVFPLNRNMDVILKYQSGFTVESSGEELKIYRY